MKMDSLNLFSSLENEINEDEDDLQDDQEDSSNQFNKSHARKSNKPIMEKRRRARINSCLNDLKGILLEAMRKDPARHSKLEKADILELTVRHLQNIQRNQLAVAMATDPTVLYRFKNGFSECASEVSRYLCKLDGVDTGMKHRVSNHLSTCVSGLQGVNPNPVVGGYPPGATRYPNNRPLPGDLGFSHMIPLFSPPQPLPTTLLTPTQAEDDLNNNNTLMSEVTIATRLSAFTSISGIPGLVGDDDGPPAVKRRLIDMDPVDYSLAKDNNNKNNNNKNNKNNNIDGEPRLVRIVKVEPTMHLPTMRSESLNSHQSGKDSMWRPW